MLIVITGYIVVTTLYLFYRMQNVFARKSVYIFIKILNVFTLCVTINSPQLTSPRPSPPPSCHSAPVPCTALPHGTESFALLLICCFFFLCVCDS